MARLEHGFLREKGGKRPPKSPKGFSWPGLRGAGGATDAQREAFRARLAIEARRKGFTNTRDFARTMYGETRDDKGYVIPRNAAHVRKLFDGDGFPQEQLASSIAAYFKIPLASLLEYDGTPYEPFALVRPKRATAARLKRVNGHKGNGHAGVAPVASGSAPALPMEPAPSQKPPKGAKPIQVELKTLPGASDWCHVNITGAVPLDVGLGLMAFIDRHKGAHTRK